MKAQNNVTVQDQDGNISKPLLANRFTLLTINISDYKSICIGNTETNRVICHMNTLDGDYDELLKQCQIMVDALNIC